LEFPSPLRGGVRGGGVSSDLRQDGRDRRFRVYGPGVGEADDAIPAAGQPGFSFGVASRYALKPMNSAVYFNDHARPMTDKVDDIGSERRLAPKMVVFDRP